MACAPRAEAAQRVVARLWYETTRSKWTVSMLQMLQDGPRRCCSMQVCSEEVKLNDLRQASGGVKLARRARAQRSVPWAGAECARGATPLTTSG